MYAEQAYLFRHALLRQAAYELQLPSTRAALHRLALAILEATPGIDLKAAALELAEHARLASEEALPAEERERLRQAEIGHLLAGARYAAAMCEAAPGILAFQRALALMGEEDPRAADTHGQLADQLSRQGRMQDAMDAFERSRALAPHSEYAGRALVHLAWLSRARGKREDALKFMQQGEAVARAISSERLAVSFLILRSVLLMEEQRLEEGLELQKEAARLAENAGDIAQSLTARANVSSALLYLGRTDEAERHLSLAEGIAQRAGNADMQALLLTQRGLLCCQRRDYAAAEVLVSQGCALARRVGARQRLLESLADLATAQIGAGRHEDVARSIAAGLELALDMGNLLHTRVMRVKAALLARARGEYVNALSQWRELEQGAPDDYARAEAGIEVALCLALAKRTQECAVKVRDLAQNVHVGSQLLAGGFEVARGLCDSVQAQEAFERALVQLEPPADDCMHDVLLAHAGLAVKAAGDERRARARAGLVEARKRGVGGDFASPHIRLALQTLNELAKSNPE